MRLRQLCLLAVLTIGATAHAEETSNTGSSTPLSLSAGSQITELQQRLKESERLREELSKQLQTADAARESAAIESAAPREPTPGPATQRGTGRRLDPLADRAAAVVCHRRGRRADRLAVRDLRQWWAPSPSTMAKLSES